MRTGGSEFAGVAETGVAEAGFAEAGFAEAGFAEAEFAKDCAEEFFPESSNVTTNKPANIPSHTAIRIRTFRLT
jgi:hypothetical protein